MGTLHTSLGPTPTNPSPDTETGDRGVPTRGRHEAPGKKRIQWSSCVLTPLSPIRYTYENVLVGPLVPSPTFCSLLRLVYTRPGRPFRQNERESVRKSSPTLVSLVQPLGTPYSWILVLNDVDRAHNLDDPETHKRPDKGDG